MKYTQRLDYGRLAEVLHEQEMASLDAIRELLEHSESGGMSFCEALVTTNLVTDWDLSRVVCETFQLPFLPVDMVSPNPAALEGIDEDFFRQHQLVPLDLFGDVMTVAMPALVTADVLAMLAAATDYIVLPVVGTVETNRRWITEHLAEAPLAEVEGGWGNLFDQADAEVQADLGDGGMDDLFGGAEGAPEESLAALAAVDLDFELDPDDEGLESSGMDLGILDSIDDAVDAAPAIQPSAPASEGESDAGGLDLPPMPTFEGGDGGGDEEQEGA